MNVQLREERGCAGKRRATRARANQRYDSDCWRGLRGQVQKTRLRQCQPLKRAMIYRA